jgi:hypothetical protein
VRVPHPRRCVNLWVIASQASCHAARDFRKIAAVSEAAAQFLASSGVTRCRLSGEPAIGSRMWRMPGDGASALCTGV